MGDRLWTGIPSRYVTNQLVNSALHPSGVAKSSISFGCGKGWNVTSAGWQVTLCDPIWHVSSSSGVATSVSELLYPCYLLTYLLDAVNRCVIVEIRHDFAAVSSLGYCTACGSN